MTRMSLLLALLVGVGTGGCVKKTGYLVEPAHTEAKRHELDGNWFLRDIYQAGKLQAIELVYCPIVPSQPVVCRSSVVWEREGRALDDHPRISRPAGAPPP
jgi:hypothetical protein